MTDTTLVHVGIRPSYELTYQKDEMYGSDAKKFKRCWIEDLPNGSKRIWTKKMLRSGCGCKVVDVKRMDDLIYCPNCDEYFNEEQWEKLV